MSTLERSQRNNIRGHKQSAARSQSTKQGMARGGNTSTSECAVAANLGPCGRSSNNGAKRGQLAIASDNRGGLETRLLRSRGQLDPRFEVRIDPSRPHRGRGIFAVENVPLGTQVIVAQECAAVPRDAYRAAFCRRCLTLLDKATLIKCRRCEDRFCGKECVIAAAGEGTHEATCAFMEELGAEKLKIPSGKGSLPPAYPPAATEMELLRLTMECLARRRAGLSSDEEWREVMSLEPWNVGGVTGRERGNRSIGKVGTGRILHQDVLKEAKEKLKGGGREISVAEIEMVHCRLRRNFYVLQPEPLGRLMPPTVLGVFPAAALVNHSCQPNSCFHTRRAAPGGPPLEYVLRCTADVAAGEEVCVSYLAHFANSTKEGRRELLRNVWGFSCGCPNCEGDVPAGSSAGDWRVTKILQDMEALLENAQARSVRETQAELRCCLEQGLQILLAGPNISPRLNLQLAVRIDEIAIRRGMHGSLRFRSAQELAERLVRAGLDSGYTADLRFTMYREALRWAEDAKLEGSHRREEQMTRASRDSLEEAIKVAAACFGESHHKTLALVECLRRLTPLHSV